MRIFLVGYMGCGKSRWGKQLANKLHLEFVDLDDLIVAQQGRTIPQIFDEEGENAFREKEHQALKSILEKDNLVVATGGGAPCFRNNMELMKKHGTTVFLQVEPAILVSRILNSEDERPLVHGKSKEEMLEYIQRHLEYRLPFYLQADHIVPAASLKISQLVDLFRDQ